MSPRKRPTWVDEELANLRAAKTGAGVHNLIFRVAKGLVPFASDAEIYDEIRDAVAGVGRFVPDLEIEKAIRNAKPYAYQPNPNPSSGTLGRPRPQRPWPTLNAEQREAILSRTKVDAAELARRSPVTLAEGSTEALIDALFPGNPLLCVGATKYTFGTRPREELRGRLSGLQLIVPSPMSAKKGKTQEGKESERTLANTGPRRFAVVEFDQGSTDEHAAILWHLRADKAAKLALVVHSGGKSLHGWYACQGEDEATVRRFYSYCVSLGADPATHSRCQFVRMPDGKRDNGKRQTALYFDPAAIGGVQ